MVSATGAAGVALVAGAVGIVAITVVMLVIRAVVSKDASVAAAVMASVICENKFRKSEKWLQCRLTDDCEVLAVTANDTKVGYHLHP